MLLRFLSNSQGAAKGKPGSKFTTNQISLTLKRFEIGESENTLRRNRLAVEKTESELQRAKESFEPVPALFEEGFLTKIQMEEERINLREAEINVENAIKDLEMYEQLTAPMELKQKEAAVREAERAQVTANERAGIAIKQKEARVSQHERHLTAVKNRIEELEKNLGYMEIKAPHAGIALSSGGPLSPGLKSAYASAPTATANTLHLRRAFIRLVTEGNGSHSGILLGRNKEGPA